MMASPRGTLPGKLSLVAAITESRIRLLTRMLDAMSDAGAGAVFGGGILPRRDHLVLLANDPNYQAAQLVRVPFSNEPERARLKRDINTAAALYPAALPESVAQPSRLGIPDLDRGV